MKCSDSKLYTPIYLKLSESMEWPQDEKAFYLLSRDGLFLCRNHPFFRSCAPATSWPAELGSQRPFLEINFPKLPALMVERIVGFFHLVAERHSSEAAALLVWNRQANAVEVFVPDQIATVGVSWLGTRYPLNVSYEMPPLPPHLMVIGDIHSHVDYPASPSFTDEADEKYRPGLHIVVGRIWDEPPEFHCEVLADGTRFKVQDLSSVMEAYQRRRPKEVPDEWMAKVRVERWSRSKSRRNAQSELDTGTHPQVLIPNPTATARPNGEESSAVNNGEIVQTLARPAQPRCN